MPTNQELIARYEQTITVLDEAIEGITPADLDRAPAPGKWTIRQILIHLADADIVLAGRIRAVAGEPDSRMPAFDQDKWAANMPYSKLPVEASLAVVRAVRTATTALLRTLPEEAWSRTGVHEQRGVLSLKDVVETAAKHGESHVRQITEHRARFAAA